MIDNEYFAEIATENINMVKTLRQSMMGNGWTLKAIFGLVLLFPYPFIVYFGYLIIKNIL